MPNINDDAIPVTNSQSLGAFKALSPDQSGTTGGTLVEIEKVAVVGPGGEWVVPLSEQTGYAILAELRELTRLLAKLAADIPYSGPLPGGALSEGAGTGG